MTTTTTLRHRFTEAVKAAGLTSDEALATRLGAHSKQTAGQWIARGTIPPKYAKPLAELGLSIEYLNTGKGSLGLAAPASQPAGLDLAKLELVLEVVEGAIQDSRMKVPLKFKANMLKRVYESPQMLTIDTAGTVRAALAGILETMSDD